MGRSLRVLIVEDSEDDLLLLVRQLRRGGFDPDYQRVESAEAMRAALESGPWEIVLSDFILPQFSGLEALDFLRRVDPDLPFIMVSGKLGEEAAVEAMRRGAQDYLVKDSLSRLAPAVERELGEAESRRRRRLAENALRLALEERARLAAAVESTVEAVVIADPRGAIRYVNPAFERMTGYSREEVMGCDIGFPGPAGPEASSLEEMLASVDGEGLWQGRRISHRRDGTSYPEECIVFAVRDGGGEIVDLVSLKRDLTEQLHLESIAQAVVTMNSVGFVVAGLRHEIGNPVNSLGMTLDLLRANLGSYDSSTIAGYLDRAREEVIKVQDLLRSLRNFNLYEKPQIETVTVGPFLEKFAALTRDDLVRRGIALRTAVHPTAGACQADPRALQQVLLNLLNNAADACAGRPGPQITLEASGASRVVQIRVTDNGLGMTPEEQQQLFRPFHTTKAKGTGLGLVLARNMLSKMQGTIAVESRKGAGTTVDILLPEATRGD